VLELLGTQDPRQVMREQVEWLRAAIARVPATALRVPERPGKWSAAALLRHLADTEWVSGYRMRKIVAEPGSAIAGYDQDAWASGLLYAAADPEESLAELATLRAFNLRWLDRLTAEELDRWGEHSERGRESVRHIVSLLGGHDLLHRAQLKRIVAAVSS
jgi:hypothetical protein